MNPLKTTNPMAPSVAREFGAICKLVDGVYHIFNGVTQADFDAILADWATSGTNPLTASQRKALDHLQSEGYGRDHGS